MTDTARKLAKVLSAVEQGTTFQIFHQGRTMVHLVPVVAEEPARTREAIARFRAEREGWTASPFSTQAILDARHEGHHTMTAVDPFATFRKVCDNCALSFTFRHQ